MGAQPWAKPSWAVKRLGPALKARWAGPRGHLWAQAAEARRCAWAWTTHAGDARSWPEAGC